MKMGRFTEEQTIRFIEQAAAGLSVRELCRKGGFGEATFYKWRAKYGRHGRARRRAPARAGRRERQAQEDAGRGPSGDIHALNTSNRLFAGIA